MNNRSVSVIVPCHNCEKYVEKTVESILCQSILPQEILLINDGSSDHSLDLLQSMHERHKEIIRLFSFDQNQGVSAVRNFGVKAAKGDYILFVDADDILEPDLLAKELERLEQLNHDEDRESYILCYSAYRQIDANDRPIGGIIKGTQLKPEEAFGYLILRNYISTTGVLVKRSSYITVGGFDESLAYSEDWDLWLRMAQHGGFAYVDEPLVNIRRHENNASAEMAKMLDGEKKVLCKYDVRHIRKAIFSRNLSIEQNCADYIAVLFKKGFIDEAYDEINNILNNGYKHYNFYFYLGLYHLLKFDYELALNNFMVTIRIKESHGAALNNLGGIYLINGQIERAKEFFIKALTFFPGYMDANHNLSLIDKKFNLCDIKFTYRELRDVLLSYAR